MRGAEVRFLPFSGAFPAGPVGSRRRHFDQQRCWPSSIRSPPVRFVSRCAKSCSAGRMTVH